MPSSLYPAADIIRLHRRIRAYPVGQRRLADSRGTREHRRPALYIFKQLSQPLSCLRAEAKCLKARMLIYPSECLTPVRDQLAFGKYDRSLQLLHIHADEVFVKQIQLRRGMGAGHHHKSYIHICHGGSYDRVLSREYVLDIALRGSLVRDDKFRIVPHHGLDISVSEYPLCLACDDPPVTCHIVKARHGLYDLSRHGVTPP